jgi:hypothetical protein
LDYLRARKYQYGERTQGPLRKLYSELQGQDVIQRPGRDLGNLPPLPAIFPDTMVPVRHAEAGERQFEMNAAGGGSHAIAPTSAKLRSSHRGEFKTCQPSESPAGAKP